MLHLEHYLIGLDLLVVVKEEVDVYILATLPNAIAISCLLPWISPREFYSC